MQQYSLNFNVSLSIRTSNINFENHNRFMIHYDSFFFLPFLFFILFIFLILFIFFILFFEEKKCYSFYSLKKEKRRRRNRVSENMQFDKCCSIFFNAQITIYKLFPMFSMYLMFYHYEVSAETL